MGKAYPQAVYFPIRTLYLTLKMEQREKCMCVCSERGVCSEGECVVRGECSEGECVECSEGRV